MTNARLRSDAVLELVQRSGTRCDPEMQEVLARARERMVVEA